MPAIFILDRASGDKIQSLGMIVLYKPNEKVRKTTKMFPNLSFFDPEIIYNAYDYIYQ